MACEVQKVAIAVAFGNAVASTPGVAFGTVAPPLEPLIAAKMWLSWVGVVVALGFLSKCLDEAGRHQDAETLRQEINKLKSEMESIKNSVPH